MPMFGGARFLESVLDGVIVGIVGVAMLLIVMSS